MARLYFGFLWLLYSFQLPFLFVLARHGHDDGNDNDRGDGDGDGDDGSSPTPVSTTSSSASNSTGAQGDMQCTALMCITATVDASTITYELQSTGSQSVGWMAMGFGSTMANSPMVIMWPNSQGAISLSQRQAPAEVMPTPVAAPSATATAAPPLSTLSGSKPKLTFTMTKPTTTKQNIIWAFGTTRPADSPSSTLQQHLDSGTLTLDLSQSLSNSTATSTPDSVSGSIPLLTYQRTIVAHALLVTIGFLLLLPLGAFVARYTRTVTKKSWFQAHWIIQAGLGGPIILTGIILGFVAVHQHGIDIPSSHKTLGKLLLALYLVQVLLGVFIHFVKLRFKYGRPPQNYGHAVLGLLIIALALYQVRLGYHNEWPAMTGRGSLPNVVNIIWTVWVVLIPVLYFAGLALLPRQYRQEKEARGRASKGQSLADEDSPSHVSAAERNGLMPQYGYGHSSRQ